MRTPLAVSLLSSLFVLAACGGDERNNDNVKFERDTGRADVTTQDMGGDTDAGGDVGQADMHDVDMAEADMPSTDCGQLCTAGQTCVDNECVLTDSCGHARDIGTLAPGVPQNLVGSLITDGVEDLEASCAATSLRDRVITFEVSTPSVITYDVKWVGQFDGVVELRSDCSQVDSALFCSDVENGSIAVPAGRYYLVLDQKFGNAGSFEVDLLAETAQCLPNQNACMGDDLVVCTDPTAPETLQCADSCTSGACLGSSCASPILVTNGGATYNGDTKAFGNNYDFATNLGCTDAGTPNSGIQTPGADVVFLLRNLEVGDVISVDAETNDTNANAVFIMKTCGDTNACVAAFRAEDPAWIVDEAGTYYVIIDKRLSSNSAFEYTVNVF